METAEEKAYNSPITPVGRTDEIHTIAQNQTNLEPVPVTTVLGTVSQSRENAGDNIRVTPRFFFSFGMMPILTTMLMVMLLSATHAYANDATEHVNRVFSVLADDSLSSGFQWRDQNNSIRIETTLQADSSLAVDNLDSVTEGYQSHGFKLGRIGASWETKAGKLTIGNDWANFQDILGVNKGFESAGISGKNRTVANQIKWISANGFSISLEDSPRAVSYSSDGTTSNNNENTYSPSLILSWQSGPWGAAGAYSVTAMGRKFDTTAEGQKFDGSKFIGWGLNMEGGWQMDDLFATLAVTFGKGIDSYILKRYGNDLVVTPNYKSGISLSIHPSLYYSLNNNSNFHVSLGHYTSDNSFNNSEIDTLDTISLGYNWSPWSSTKLGVELVGQNSGGRDGGVEVSGQIKFDAQKRF